METLFVQLNPDHESAQWLVLNAEDKPQATIRQGPISSLKEFTRQRRVVCTLSSNDIFITNVALPHSRNQRKLHQAIPYALEDELAEDIGLLHFAVGKAPAASTSTTDDAKSSMTMVPVAIINKSKLRAWLDTLEQAGIKPHVLLPDILTVPMKNQSGWNVLLNGNVVLLRTGPFTGFTCDPENLPILLDSALNQSEGSHPEHIHILSHNSNISEIKLENDAIDIETTETEQEWISSLARGYSKTTLINLLQGEFSFREEYGKLLKPWLIPGILLGVLVSLGLGGKIMQNIQLNNQLEELDANIIQVYKQVFPNSRNATEPRRQLEDKLKQLGGSNTSKSDFLSLLHPAAKHIIANETAAIESITFNGDRLDIDITVKEVAQMDALKQTIEKEQLTVEINSISAEGDKVSGQLRISK